MNETAFSEVLELEQNENTGPGSQSENSINEEVSDAMRVGILGCGAIANIITNFAADGKLDVDLKCFYDKDMERAENMASQIDGMVAMDIKDMRDQVDLVVEAASPQAVVEIIPQILKMEKDVVIMSVGALMDQEFRKGLEKIALRNKSRIYTPSGAIVGLDGIKAASMGKITEVNLVTRKPPKSLGIFTDKEKVLYEGKSSEAVLKFPININVAAALTIACGKEANVKIIADPAVNRNSHEVHVIGDFGELKTTTQNKSCATNQKTSVLAAYSVIKLLKSLNENSRIGT